MGSARGGSRHAAGLAIIVPGPAPRKAESPAPMPADSSAHPSPPIQFYQDRRDEFSRQAQEENHRSTRMTRIRIAVFIAAVVPLLAIETSPAGWGWPLAGLGALFLVIFGVLVGIHRRIRRTRDRYLRLATLAGEGLARIRRDWDHLPPATLAAPRPEHPYALDLDVTGDASLARLLRPPGTPTGRTTLRTWLLEPAPPDQVAARQEAVRELAPHVDFRDELTLAAAPARSASPAMARRFGSWAEGDRWLLGRPLLIWGSRLIPVATVTLLLAHLAGPLTQPLWLLPMGLTLAILYRNGDRLREGIEPASEHEGAVRAYQEVLRLAGGSPSREPTADGPSGSAPPFEAAPLASIRERVAPNGAEATGGAAAGPQAHQEIGRLRRILDSADVRSSGMVHFPLQLLLMWDFHVLLALERWKRRSGERVAAWLEAAGELEALAALAGLAHDHPAWTYPEVVERSRRENGSAAEAERPASDRYEAEELGHPLLPPDACVRNNVSLGPPGSFLLVTGSNMSGKSTLLRAVGLNAVLAQAGGPVCATSLSLPPLRVWTSMRVQDSLSQGVSFFMAELQRLRAVVEAAGDPEADTPTLYLLDEILQGTNTAERQIAARRIIRTLLETDSIGAVTTHDLTLADTPEVRSRAQSVHFREHVEKRPDPETGREKTVITFDYHLREGVATSRNALQLMEAVGLGSADGEEPTDASEPNPAGTSGSEGRSTSDPDLGV